jgi:hypothetical protein
MLTDFSRRIHAMSLPVLQAALLATFLVGSGLIAVRTILQRCHAAAVVAQRSRSGAGPYHS